MMKVIILVTKSSVITLHRWGTYGSVDVDWSSGYPTGRLPPGFTSGMVTPRSGMVTMIHGQENKTFTLKVT